MVQSASVPGVYEKTDAPTVPLATIPEKPESVAICTRNPDGGHDGVTRYAHPSVGGFAAGSVMMAPLPGRSSTGAAGLHAVGDGDGVGVAVGVGVGVGVGVTVGVGEADGERLAVGAGVRLGESVGVGLGVGVEETDVDGVADGDGPPLS